MNFKKRKNTLGGWILTIVVSLFLFVAVGWGMNLYKLVHCDFEAPYKAEVIHTIGLVPFVGAFTGYMDLGK